MLVGLADCCYRGEAASWPRQKLSRLTEMSRWPEIQKFTRLFSRSNPKIQVQVTKADIRRVIPVDRPRKADGGGGSCSSLESLQLEPLVPGLFTDDSNSCRSVWCFRERVSLLGIPKCCPSSTKFVSAASLHH